MKISSDRQYRDVHKATVDQDEMLRIVAERVAEKTGLKLGMPGVIYRAFVYTRDTSEGFRYDVKVEIIDDHNIGKPGVAKG